MLIFTTIFALQTYLKKHDLGRQIGFIPTMGALHDGHLSLLRKAQLDKKITLLSIFVNPTQFNNASDFEKYPSQAEQDIELLVNAGCSLLFMPNATEIYPNEYKKVEYNLGSLAEKWEGEHRPGHFAGVWQVMDRLLQIVQTGTLYMGEKDFQQCLIVQRLIIEKNWESNWKMITCATLREPNGLAKSSRNARLTDAENEQAAVIYKSLQFIKTNIKPGSLSLLLQEAEQRITKEGLKVEYIGVAEPTTLQPIMEWDGVGKWVALVAVWCGEVRLIDNITSA